MCWAEKQPQWLCPLCKSTATASHLTGCVQIAPSSGEGSALTGKMLGPCRDADLCNGTDLLLPSLEAGLIK